MGYGPARCSLSGFSWRGPGRLGFRPRPSSGRGSRACAGGICLPGSLHPFRGYSVSRFALPRASPRRSIAHRAGRGNLGPLPVGHASRPRLRDRLTPGGLAFPGNPRAYGARAFHPRFRILMPAFSFPMPPGALAGPLPRRTGRSPTAPHRCGAHDFGGALSPDHFGRGRASTSELLRFL